VRTHLLGGWSRLTGQIVDDSFTTATLAPGQSLQIDLHVVVGPHALLGRRKPLDIVVSSRVDPAIEDVVAAQVDITT
jgi:hypothetical protein